MAGERVAASGSSQTGAQYLMVPWTLDADTRGVVYAETPKGLVRVGTFDHHILAADAVCSHNAILEVRPRG